MSQDDLSDKTAESLAGNGPSVGYTHLIRQVDGKAVHLTATELTKSGRSIAESLTEAAPDTITTATVGDKFAWNPARKTGNAAAKIGAGLVFSGLTLGIYSIASSVDYSISEPIETVTGTLASGGLLPMAWGAADIGRAARSQSSTDTRGQTEAAAGMLYRTTRAGTEALQVVPDSDPAATDSRTAAVARHPSQKPQSAAFDRLPDQQTGQWEAAGRDLTHMLSPDRTELPAGTTVKLVVITVAQQTPAARVEKGRGASTEATTGTTKADELLEEAANYSGKEPLVMLSKVAPYARGVPDTSGLADKREDGLLNHPLGVRRPASYLTKYVPRGGEGNSLFRGDESAAERLRETNDRSLSSVRLIAASTNTSREIDTIAQELKAIVDGWTSDANVTAQANVQTVTVGENDSPLNEAFDLTTFYRVSATRSLRAPSGSPRGLHLTVPRHKDTKLRHGDQFRALAMDNTEVGSLFVISKDSEGATDLIKVDGPDDSQAAGGPTVDRTRLDGRR